MSSFAGESVSPWITSTTARLALTAISADDIDQLFAITSDPGVWEHFPQGRHDDIDKTKQWIEMAVRQWGRTGLGYWAVRLRDDPDAQMIGIGGVARPKLPVWNLYYRFAPTRWGNGYAGELVVHALAAARKVDPSLPVTAHLLEHNERSRRLAERSGLHLVHRGPERQADPNGPVRLIFGDRELPAELLAGLVG